MSRADTHQTRPNERLCVPMALDGMRIFNSPDNYLAYHNLLLAQFDGNNWVSLKDMPTTN